MAFYLAPIRNAEDIMRGAKPPNALAVRASDDFTFQFELEAPAPSFLKLLWQPFLAAVPRQSVEAARRRGHASSWMEPAHLICSGPFLLRQWRPYDRMVLARNPLYWEALSVVMEEIVFLPVSNGATNVNLYRAGTMNSMDPRLFPRSWSLHLSKRRTLPLLPLCGRCGSCSTLAPIRWTGLRFVCTQSRYRQEGDCDVSRRRSDTGQWNSSADGRLLSSHNDGLIHGRELNIVAFDPPTARELLRAEGIRDLKLSINFPTLPNIRDVSAIVQRQWHEYASVEVSLTEQGSAEWLQDMNDKRYRHVTQDSWTARCVDPADYLALFGPPAHYSAWTDTAFDSNFVKANRILDHDRHSRPSPRARLSLSGRCQQYRFIHDSWTYLAAPWLRGLTSNPFAAPDFKYSWIDTRWRPQP